MTIDSETETLEDIADDRADGFVAVYVDPRGRARAALVPGERQPRFAPRVSLADPPVFAGTIH
jgi:hypothetical protein